MIVPRLKRRLAGLAVAGLAALLTAAAADPAAARGEGERRARSDDSTLTRPAGVPLLAIVSLAEQRVTIYDAEGRILRAPVSTGQRGYETPAGIYSVIQKEREHYSNLYDDASMPFMQRITWSGIALHAGALPGYPASHGCIRMPYSFAERLFDLTRMGLRVVVMPRDAAPVAISHPTLFKPAPVVAEAATANPPETVQKMRLGGEPGANVPPPTISPRRLVTLKSIAAAKAAEAEAAAKKAETARLAATRSTGEATRAKKAVALAEREKARADSELKSAELAFGAAEGETAKQRAEEAKAKAQAKVDEAEARLKQATAEADAKADAAARARDAAKAADAERASAAGAAREATARMSPVSVFVSRQAQRIYVRQAFQPLLDMPLTIRDPDKPIGTHIFTALDYVDDGADVRWNVVTMTSSGQRAAENEAETYGRRSYAKSRGGEPAATDVAAAKAALDRIAIPAEAAQKIAEVVSPGSSLIISDEPVSKETGKGTDFIVIMSGEPQGGIKIRSRPQQPRWYDDDDDERGYRRQPYPRRSPWSGGGPFFRW